MRKYTKNALRLKSARSFVNMQRLEHSLRGHQLANCNYIVVERDSRVIPIFEKRSMLDWQIAEAQNRLFLVA